MTPPFLPADPNLIAMGVGAGALALLLGALGLLRRSPAEGSGSGDGGNAGGNPGRITVPEDLLLKSFRSKLVTRQLKLHDEFSADSTATDAGCSGSGSDGSSSGGRERCVTAQPEDSGGISVDSSSS